MIHKWKVYVQTIKLKEATLVYFCIMAFFFFFYYNPSPSVNLFFSFVVEAYSPCSWVLLLAWMY